MVSDKQRQILLKDGFSEQAINRMSYEEISKNIGEILNRPKEKVVSDKKWPENGYNKQKTANKEYHLTPEAVKIAALNSALDVLKPSTALENQDNVEFWNLVIQFENYINGKQ